MMELPEGIEAGGLYFFTWPPETQNHFYFSSKPSIVQTSWVDPLRTLLVTCNWVSSPEANAILTAAARLTRSEFAAAQASVSLVLLEARTAGGEFTEVARSDASSGYSPYQTIFQIVLSGSCQGEDVTLRITYEAVLHILQSLEVSCELSGDLSVEMDAVRELGGSSVFDCQERIEEAIEQQRLLLTIHSSVGTPQEQLEKMTDEVRQKVVMDTARTMRDLMRKSHVPDFHNSVAEYRNRSISRLSQSVEMRVRCSGESDVTLS